MSRPFRLRNLFLKYPALDAFRLNLLGGICTHGMRFFDSSYKVIKIASKGARPFISDRKSPSPAIFAVYHGRMVGLLGIDPREKVTILISQSRDGEIVARAVKGIGFSVARGSPAHGAMRAAKEMVKAAESGQSLAFMVDGPRGPRYSVKPSIIRLAEMTGLPIVPFVNYARSKWWFGSWDRFMGPLWSTPIVYVFGDPIYVPADLTNAQKEEKRAELESSMADLRSRAESYFQ